MTNRRSVVVLSWLYIAAGMTGLIYHALTWSPDEPVAVQAWVLALRVLAVVGGVFTLRGAVWSRWLLVAWMGYHVVLSIGHETSQLVAHVMLLLLTAVVLLLASRTQAAPWQGR